MSMTCSSSCCPGAVRVSIPGVPGEGPVSVIIQNLQLNGGYVSLLPGEGSGP